MVKYRGSWEASGSGSINGAIWMGWSENRGLVSVSRVFLLAMHRNIIPCTEPPPSTRFLEDWNFGAWGGGGYVSAPDDGKSSGDVGMG